MPEGAQTGRQIRLKGKGMPVLRSRQSGDMYVQIVVETPQNLSRRQRELLEEFERVSNEREQSGIDRLLLQGEGFSRRDGGEVEPKPSPPCGERVWVRGVNAEHCSKTPPLAPPHKGEGNAAI